MQTFNRICIEDLTIRDNTGQCFEIKRGKEYLTSAEEDGKVTVFTNFWVKVPITHFAGEKEFTKATEFCPTCNKAK